MLLHESSSGTCSVTLAIENIDDGFHLLLTHRQDCDGFVKMPLSLWLLTFVHELDQQLLHGILFQLNEHMSL